MILTDLTESGQCVTQDGNRITSIMYSLWVSTKNIAVANGISLLSCLEAVLCAVKVQRPPSWIFHYFIGRDVFKIALLESVTLKTGVWPLELCF